MTDHREGLGPDRPVAYVTGARAELAGRWKALAEAGYDVTALELGKGVHPAPLGTLQPGVQHQRGEFLLLVDLAEDRADLADDELEHVDLLVEDAQHRILDRAGSDQVEDEHLARLADPVDAPDALLDGHRVPGALVHFDNLKGW